MVGSSRQNHRSGRRAARSCFGRARSCLNPRWPPSSSTGDGPRNVAPLRRGARRHGGLEEGDDRVGAAPELGAGRHSARRRRPAPSGTPGSTVPGRPARDSPVAGGTVGSTVSGRPAGSEHRPRQTCPRQPRHRPTCPRPTRPRQTCRAADVPAVEAAVPGRLRTAPAADPSPVDRPSVAEHPRRRPSAPHAGPGVEPGSEDELDAVASGPSPTHPHEPADPAEPVPHDAAAHHPVPAPPPAASGHPVSPASPAPRAVGPGRRRRHRLRPYRGR